MPEHDRFAQPEFLNRDLIERIRQTGVKSSETTCETCGEPCTPWLLAGIGVEYEGHYFCSPECLETWLEP